MDTREPAETPGRSEGKYEEFRHLDQVSVVLKFGTHPMFEPTEIIDMVLGQPAPGFDERPVIAELEAVLKSPDGYRHNYVLDLRKSHHSWGADAAVAQIVAYIGNAALDAGAGAVASAALLAFFRKAKELVGRSGDGIPDNPPTRDEMYERARQKIDL